MRSVCMPACHFSVRSRAAPFLRLDQRCRSRRAERPSSGCHTAGANQLHPGRTRARWHARHPSDLACLQFSGSNRPSAMCSNCILSQLFAGFDAWEVGSRGHTDRGRQGKSAAFGPAHVVDGVEVLRGDENDHAVAALRNLKEINASRAVGLRKWAVRHHEASATMKFASAPDAFATAGVACRVRRALSARSCGPQRRPDMSATVLGAARAVRAGLASVGAGVLRSPCRCARPHDVW